MANNRRLAKFNTPALLQLRIESERALQKMETADVARRIADALDDDGAAACDGQTALRMFASRLEASAQSPL